MVMVGGGVQGVQDAQVGWDAGDACASGLLFPFLESLAQKRQDEKEGRRQGFVGCLSSPSTYLGSTCCYHTVTML